MVSPIETKSRNWPEVCSIPKLVELMDGAISEASLYSRANQGGLPGCRRIGHRLLVHVPTFLDYIASGTGDDHQGG
jgi:hypothetical protein